MYMDTDDGFVCWFDYIHPDEHQMKESVQKKDREEYLKQNEGSVR